MSVAAKTIKGRAARYNAANRFERVVAEAAPILRAQLSNERPRRVISRTTSPDLAVGLFVGQV